MCSFEENPQSFAISKAEILPRPSRPHSPFTCELLPQFPLWKCCFYYRISLSLPLFEEKPLLIRLPSRSSCHFLFLSCLWQSSHRLLCFFCLFLPQSCCSLPAWVKPGVSFPHLPPSSNRTSSDMWLPLPLPMCVFSLGVTLYYSQTWPGCLANSSALEHSSESLSISWFISAQLSLLSSTFSSLKYRAKSGIFWTFLP